MQWGRKKMNNCTTSKTPHYPPSQLWIHISIMAHRHEKSCNTSKISLLELDEFLQFLSKKRLKSYHQSKSKYTLFCLLFPFISILWYYYVYCLPFFSSRPSSSLARALFKLSSLHRIFCDLGIQLFSCQLAWANEGPLFHVSSTCRSRDF